MAKKPETTNKPELSDTPAITPEAIAADKRARETAARDEFQELCRRHRVAFEPVFVINRHGIIRDFEIVAQ